MPLRSEPDARRTHPGSAEATYPLLVPALAVDCRPALRVCVLAGGRAMADERLIRQGLDALEGLVGLVLEEALEQALGRPPDDATERLHQLHHLRQAGTDVVTLADAAAALLRRWPAPGAKGRQ